MYLTLEEKIEHLQNASMEEARHEGNQIIAEHKIALEQIFQDHKDVALRQAELTVKTETNNAKQQLNKAMAKSQTELKREQGKCQTILKDKLFTRVHELLEEFMKTPVYDDLMLAYIISARKFAGDESMTIYIHPDDEQKKADLEKRTGTSLTISTKDFMGGIRAVMHERNILIDHSFSSALEREYDNFLFSGGERNE